MNATDIFYSFPAPAKLNLFLHVIGQRADGYHELETVFQFLDYCDTLDIALNHQNNEIEILTPVAGVATRDNLIYKAAVLLQTKTATTLGAKINIHKVLPMGGGLGGGSSNAATVLMALNLLWKTNLSIDELANLGLTLGADVPVFVRGYAAFAQGVGEKLHKISPKEYWYLVSKPNCSIATQDVFQSKDLPRNSAKININDIPLVNAIDQYHNDCQTMVIKHYPEVANLLAWLLEYAPSQMTGTGACIFTRFTSQTEAKKLQSKLPRGIDSFVAKGNNQSALSDRINQIKAQLKDD